MRTEPVRPTATHKAMERLSDVLARWFDAGLSKTELQQKAGGNAAANRLALERLQKLGYVEEARGPGGVRQYPVIPYKAAYGDDPAG